MKISIAFMIAIALAGCGMEPPAMQTRLVEVASSKPYRFITYDLDHDSAETLAQIQRHNRAHQAVKNAEAKAKP